MDLIPFLLLLTSDGQAALQTADALQPDEQHFLAHFQAMGRRFPAELARAALEIAIQRRKAVAKFPFADKLYFTREALEQASAWEVSNYRLRRYAEFPLAVDLGCSAGGDLLALAGLTQAVGVDLDPLRLALAQANLQVLRFEQSARLLQADLLAPLPLYSARHAALFFDPARRSAERRLFAGRDYQPPLQTLRDWLPRYPALGVKISPGVNLAELSAYPAGLEFISLRGELKEAVLWFGPFYQNVRSATVLPGAHTLSADERGWQAVQALSARLSEPLAYIYEPDPAILRAGLVRLLAQQIDACQLDPDISYLTNGNETPTPFARVWAVLDWFPYQLKRLRAYLRQHNVGHVTVKKRGSPLQPADLIQSLRLSGDESRLLFLTHLRGRPIVIVAAPISHHP
jgi:hypothetical protein